MNRRRFVGALVAAPLMAWAGNLLAKTFQYPGIPPTSPNQFPGNSTTPTHPEMTQMPSAPEIDPHTVLVYHQKQLKKDVNHLYDLAQKLRNQVNKTDSTAVLSLDMLHTAEEIEKLAKQIRDLARG